MHFLGWLYWSDIFLFKSYPLLSIYQISTVYIEQVTFKSLHWIIKSARVCTYNLTSTASGINTSKYLTKTSVRAIIEFETQMMVMKQLWYECTPPSEGPEVNWNKCGWWANLMKGEPIISIQGSIFHPDHQMLKQKVYNYIPHRWLNG